MYINDIIIFSTSLKDHIQHFDQILNLLKISEIILSLVKCHFAYLNIIVYYYYVFKLNLSIMKKKLKIVRKIIFSRNLRELKIDLNFFDYYQKFVKNYAIIVKSLIQLKIKDFKKKV